MAFRGFFFSEIHISECSHYLLKNKSKNPYLKKNINFLSPSPVGERKIIFPFLIWHEFMTDRYVTDIVQLYN